MALPLTAAFFRDWPFESLSCPVGGAECGNRTALPAWVVRSRGVGSRGMVRAELVSSRGNL